MASLGNLTNKLAKSVNSMFGSTASFLKGSGILFDEDESQTEHKIEDNLLEIQKTLCADTGLLSAQEHYSSIYVSIQHRNWQERTTIVRDNHGKSRFDQVKHFPVNIVTNRAHPFNLLRLDFIGIGQHGDEHRIGGILFHIHDIITGTPLAREFQIAGTHLMIGRVNLELTFNYGAFGYGMDRQLQEEDCSFEELLAFSLFPRLNPDEEEVNQHGYIIKSQAIPHPNFIPFQKRVYLSYAIDIKKELEAIGKTTESRTSFEAGMKKTEAVRQHYYKLEDRAVRLRWLHSYVQRSSKRQEIVSEPGNHHSTEEFPSKKYIKFLKPLTGGRGGGDDIVVRQDGDRQILNAVTVQEMDMRRPTQNKVAYKLQRKLSSLMAYKSDSEDVL